MSNQSKTGFNRILLPSCETNPGPECEMEPVSAEQSESEQLVVFVDFYNTTVWGFLREPIELLMQILGLQEKVSWKEFLVRCLTIKHDDPGLYIENVAQEFDVPVTETMRDEFVRLVEADKNGLRLFPDVLDELNALKAQGFRLGLITDSWPFPVRPILVKTGLDQVLDPALIVSSHEVGTAKQQGTDIYEEAVRRAGVPASRCMMIGDNPISDIRRARQSGMSPVLIIRQRDGETTEHAEAASKHPEITGTDVPIIRGLREIQPIARKWAARLNAR